MKLATLSGKLNELTRRPICKVCFKDISRKTVLTFFFKDPCLCSECLEKMNNHFSKGKIAGVPIIALGSYQGFNSELIIRYKENLDIELSPVFLAYFAPFIKTRFFNYSLVLVPSSESKIKKRGFNHLYEIFKFLKMPILDLLSKEEGKEQKKRNAEERKESAKLFHLKNQESLKGKKILLCDDVITTGSSLKACLGLLRQLNPKKIQVLVLTSDADLSSYS